MHIYAFAIPPVHKIAISAQFLAYIHTHIWKFYTYLCMRIPYRLHTVPQMHTKDTIVAYLWIIGCISCNQ